MPPLQTRLPYDIRTRPRLPGIKPLGDAPWLIRDEAFALQMAERDRLIAEAHERVIALDDTARPAAEELLESVLAAVYPGASDVAQRPDGVEVPIDRSAPMATLGRLVQEDLCIMEKRGDEHVLTAAALCFPAYWTLAEKFMRPLLRIHQPVASYDDDVGKRVQRLFDGIRAGAPLWRFNAHWYRDPDLMQVRPESHPRKTVPAEEGRYLRSERQVLLRLPRSNAVVFSIHTYMLGREDAVRALA